MDRGAHPGRSSALGAFIALGKLGIVELWLGFFVGASLLGRRAVLDTRALAILGLVLLLGIVVIAVTCSLDDITGARDGVDQANHGGGRRWGVEKPLLTGRLTERQALSMVWAAGAFGLVCFAGVLALAWPLPGWLAAAMALIVLLSLNYSWGLQLSYLGAGELVVFAGGFGTVMIPYALVAGSVTEVVLVSSALVGAWHAQIVLFSNTHDAKGDRRAGRRTLAARTTARGNKGIITAFFVVCWALSGVALATGKAPLLYAVALCPVWGMQIFQLWTGVRNEQWLRARRVGFRVLRIGVLALTLANIASG